MKKIRITFKISQKLSGEIKTVNVVDRSIEKCWDRINRAMDNYKHTSASVLNVEEISDTFPSGIFQANSQTVISHRNIASVIPGNAIHKFNSEPGQNKL